MTPELALIIILIILTPFVIVKAISDRLYRMRARRITRARLRGLDRIGPRSVR
jgi:hypothetical protein